MIKLENIVKTYPMGKRELTVLKGIYLDIKQGELVAVMGPSGSGKTTLLNLLGCLDVPTSGSYRLEGREVSRLGGRELAHIRGEMIGFIFQTFNLLSRLTALANVELGLTYAGGVDRKQALEALAKVGLSERVNHRPIELSGGEQQRVAIARAIAKNPSVFLADEPTGQLDRRHGHLVMEHFEEIIANGDTAVIIVTHDPDIAARCSRVCPMEDGVLHGLK